MTITENHPTLPFARSDILGLAPLFYELQEHDPVARVRTPTGDFGWLVTRHADVKQLLADPRLGRGHAEPERAARYSRSRMEGGPLGDPETEDAEYGRMRSLLSPSFAPRRMHTVHDRILALVDDLFDQALTQPGPVDFHEAIAFQLPVMVICRLLGVPEDDRDRFRGWLDAATALYDQNQIADGYAALMGYTDELVRLKREKPGEDIITDLLAAVDESEAAAKLPQLVAGLLYAGYETTVERLGFGALHLLARPDQMELLRKDPSLMPSAVEEVLRVAAPGRPPRIAYARADLEVRGVSIKSGDLVMLAIQAANHDPRVFEEPQRFDVTRSPNPHLSFGYGGHFCLGASMARLELEAVFSALVRREPALRLAAPVEELLQHENPSTGGLTALPITW
ncbi:Pentalenolactone synthase [Streptomyces sp. enrichment culture]|uniref:cytochrome P450 n=1 Tax=Streptomyces sp. enrichment culture TaxID=1795815 RepID=UPI003F57A25D